MSQAMSQVISNQMWYKITFLQENTISIEIYYGIYWQITISRFHSNDNLFRNKPTYPGGTYLFKANNGNTRTMREICSNLVSLLLTLNRFHTFFWCFYCWTWTSNCLLSMYLIVNRKLINHTNMERTLPKKGTGSASFEHSLMYSQFAAFVYRCSRDRPCNWNLTLAT